MMNMILLIYLLEKILFPPGNDEHDYANLPVRDDPVPSSKWWTWFSWIYLWWSCSLQAMMDMILLDLPVMILFPPGNDGHNSANLPVREDPVPSWQWWMWCWQPTPSHLNSDDWLIGWREWEDQREQPRPANQIKSNQYNDAFTITYNID